MQLLQFFGYFPNGNGDYILFEAKSTAERTQRTEAAREFRQFYDELKQTKDEAVPVLEYCLSVGLFAEKSTVHLTNFASFSIGMMRLQQLTYVSKFGDHLAFHCK